MTARGFKQGDLVVDTADPQQRWAMVLTPQDYNRRSEWLITARVTRVPRGSSMKVSLGPEGGAVRIDAPLCVPTERARKVGQAPPEVTQQVVWTLQALID